MIASSTTVPGIRARSKIGGYAGFTLLSSVRLPPDPRRTGPEPAPAPCASAAPAWPVPDADGSGSCAACARITLLGAAFFGAAGFGAIVAAVPAVPVGPGT